VEVIKVVPQINFVVEATTRQGALDLAEKEVRFNEDQFATRVLGVMDEDSNP